jgi:hypothetical protein
VLHMLRYVILIAQYASDVIVLPLHIAATYVPLHIVSGSSGVHRCISVSSGVTVYHPLGSPSLG